MKKYRITKAICYHEAGHAILAWRKGRVYEASVIPDSNSLGHVKLSFVGGIDPEDIRICVAGCYAQAMWAKTSVGMWVLGGGQEDYDRAVRFANTIALFTNQHITEYQVTGSGILDQAEKDARSWLKSLWPAVEAVSNALYTQHTLSGEQVDKLIKGALKGKLSESQTMLVELKRARKRALLINK